MHGVINKTMSVIKLIHCTFSTQNEDRVRIKLILILNVAGNKLGAATLVIKFAIHHLNPIAVQNV